MEELKGELGELEPELKATQEEGQRLTHALSQQRAHVAHIRDQMLAQEEKVKVSTGCRAGAGVHPSASWLESFFFSYVMIFSAA